MAHDPAPDPQAPPSYTVEGRLGQRWWTWQRFAEHDDAARAIAALIEARRFDAIRLLETRHRVGRPPDVLRELFHYDPAAVQAAPFVVEPAVAEPVVVAAPVIAPVVVVPASVAPVPVAPVTAAARPAMAGSAAAPAIPPAFPAPLMGAPAARAVADAFARMEAEVSAQEQRDAKRREAEFHQKARRAAADAATTKPGAPPAAWPALWQTTIAVVPAAAPPPAAATKPGTPAHRDPFDDTGLDDYAPLVAAEEPLLPVVAATTPASAPTAAPTPPATWDPAEIDAAMAALRAALREVEAIVPAVAQPSARPSAASQAIAQAAPSPKTLAVEEPVFTASDRPSVAPANDDGLSASVPAADVGDADGYWDAEEPPRVARQGQWRFRLRRVGYSLGTTAAAILLAVAGYETTRLTLGLPDLLGEARHVAGALLAGPERPIVAAARRGDGAEVERLLKGGFSADSDDPQGVPVLLVAARAGHADIVRALLDAGGDPNRRFGQAETPILAATREGLVTAVDAMLTRGGQVNGRGGADDCETPLLVAAASGRLEMVTFLLARGATFDVLPGCRRGPMDAAAPHPRVRDALENAYQRRLAAVPRGTPVIAPAVATDSDLAPSPRSAALAPPPLPATLPPPKPAVVQPAIAQPAVPEPSGYGVLMYGFTWRESLAEVKAKAKECHALGRRYEVCTLTVTPMFDDAATVEAWFDRADGDRFVSIETRSTDLIDYTAQRDGAAVRRRFDEVRRALERFLPANPRPIVQRNAPPGSMTFFEGLKPDVAAGDYSAFWSDDSRRRPASVHLKMSGIDNRKGFYRIVVSNPLRQTQQAAVPTK